MTTKPYVSKSTYIPLQQNPMYRRAHTYHFNKTLRIEEHTQSTSTKPYVSKSTHNPLQQNPTYRRAHTIHFNKTLRIEEHTHTTSTKPYVFEEHIQSTSTKPYVSKSTYIPLQQNPTYRRAHTYHFNKTLCI